jgi:hypothetical protein
MQDFCLRDFSQDWLSAHNFVSGEPPYEPLQVAVERAFGNESAASVQAKLPYNAHPPGAVLLSLPLGLLDYRSAFLGWTVASLVALVASLALLSQMLYDTTWQWGLLPVGCLVVSSHALQESLYHGQLNCFILLLLTGACFARQRGALWSAGAFLALATYLKLFPALFFVALLLAGDYKLLLAGLAWLAALVLLGVLVLGVQNHLDYAFGIAPSISRDHMASWGNHSIPALWCKLFNPGRPSFEPLLQSSALERTALAASWTGVLLLLWQAARNERQRYDTRDVAFFSLVTVLAILMSPVAWDHYFLLLLLPMAWLYARTRSFAWGRLGLVIRGVILWLPQWTVWRRLLPGRIHGETVGRLNALQTATGHSVQLYALIGLLALCILTDRWTGTRHGNERFCEDRREL